MALLLLEELVSEIVLLQSESYVIVLIGEMAPFVGEFALFRRAPISFVIRIGLFRGDGIDVADMVCFVM